MSVSGAGSGEFSGRKKGKLVENALDRLNVARGLAAPIILFFPFWYGFPAGYEVISAIAIFFLIGETNYILHLHIHRPFATKAWLNLLLDLSMGLSTGWMASNWRIQHRYGHHCGIDTPYRAAQAWECAKFSPLRAVSFSARSVVSSFIHPVTEAFRKGVLRNVRNPLSYRWAFAEQLLLILFVLGLLAWQPRLVLFFLLPWYALIAFISRYVDYLNHYGCDERSPNPYERANNSLSRSFNWGCSNFGYHTAHHLHPTAHWSELPSLHAEIAHRIPAKHLKPFSWSCLLFPYHCLRARRGRM